MTPAQSPTLVKQLATLSDNYATLLPGKLRQLEQSLRQCQTKAAAHADFESLRLTVHTLAGSGTGR